jgi:ATP phosphoribosyltransferase regulatory subunit
MQAPQPSISGTRDYAGDDAVALQTARDAIEATLRRYAYAPINPPILESPLPFLNRSGEDVRRHMYIFPDPGGSEVCLRPELTIPVCRAYLRQRQAAGNAAEKSPEHEARLCYFGPAFTYESANDRRYRQFYQAGAEFIGAQARESADAEILAAALDALQAAGLKETRVEIGDVEIRNAFIDQLPVSERSKTRIRRVALRNQKEPRTSDAVTKPGAVASDTPTEFSELASLLAGVEPSKAELLIREVFALADVRHVGGRTPEEIVERLISRTAQQTEPVAAELMQGVLDLLNIRAKPETAFKQIREHFRKFRIGSIDRVLERCEKRLRYINAYRQQPLELQFNVGLRRGLEYYTGFLFEIYAKNFAEIGHVCGGGRYDNLLDGLGASGSIPAVGFGIGLDHLLPALQKARAAAAGVMPEPQALIVAVCSNREEECIAASAALRHAGCSVELDVSGRDERAALTYAAKRKISCVILIGGDKSRNGQARVRRLDSRGDQIMPIASLASYVKGAGGTGTAP